MRARPVDDRAAGVVDVIGRDQRPRLEAENAGERSGRGGAEQLVDLVRRRRPLQLEDAIGQRGVEHRHAHGMAVQPALQLGIDQRDRRRAAGRRRLQRQHRRARAAQILVRRVDHDIGVGRVVDRRDLAVADADRLVHDLDHRREAVGGAGRRRQQPVLARVVAIVIDADDDVERRRRP